MINLKLALEFRMLHEKQNHLIRNQQEELIEIQDLQIEMIDYILNEVTK